MCRGNGKPCSSKLSPYCKRHGPTKADGPGHIYVYRLEGDLPNYYKIGRTAKGVKKRLNQWGHKTVLVASYYVAYQKMAERFIHGLLNHIRVYRYKLEDGSYYSVWKRAQKVSVDGVEMPNEKLQGIKKHVEWFKGSWEDDMEKHVEWVVNEVNGLPRVEAVPPLRGGTASTTEEC